MATTTSTRIVTFLLRDLLGDLVYFPVWWYTVGLRRTLTALWRDVSSMADRLALRIMVRTLFKPMYGDYTRSGRIISFFFRLFLIAVRTIVIAIYAIVLLLAAAAWVLGPVLAGALLIRQIVPV